MSNRGASSTLSRAKYWFPSALAVVVYGRMLSFGLGHLAVAGATWLWVRALKIVVLVLLGRPMMPICIPYLRTNEQSDRCGPLCRGLFYHKGAVLQRSGGSGKSALKRAAQPKRMKGRGRPCARLARRSGAL